MLGLDKKPENTSPKEQPKEQPKSTILPPAVTLSTRAPELNYDIGETGPKPNEPKPLQPETIPLKPQKSESEIIEEPKLEDHESSKNKLPVTNPISGAVRDSDSCIPRPPLEKEMIQHIPVHPLKSEQVEVKSDRKQVEVKSEIKPVEVKNDIKPVDVVKNDIEPVEVKSDIESSNSESLSSEENEIFVS